LPLEQDYLVGILRNWEFPKKRVTYVLLRMLLLWFTLVTAYTATRVGRSEGLVDVDDLLALALALGLGLGLGLGLILGLGLMVLAQDADDVVVHAILPAFQQEEGLLALCLLVDGLDRLVDVALGRKPQEQHQGAQLLQLSLLILAIGADGRNILVAAIRDGEQEEVALGLGLEHLRLDPLLAVNLLERGVGVAALEIADSVLNAVDNGRDKGAELVEHVVHDE